jgi:hypothetical protein
VDDSLLMGVLNGLADGDEQLQALLGREMLLVTVAGDGDALDKLHDEVRAAAIRGAGIEHLGDVRVIHDRQGLPLLLEAGNDLGGVHAGLDDL